MEKTEEFEENEDIESEEFEETEESNKKRVLVIPGEIISTNPDMLPGDFVRKEGENLIAMRYGLAEEDGRVVRIIPVSGAFEPRRGNSVLGIVTDITYNGWLIDIDAPYGAFLPVSECKRFIHSNDIEDYAGIGDVVNAKIFSVKRKGIDLTLKSKGLGVLEGGRLIKINPNKVPRVIGRGGSMINLIKDSTKTRITVGQNGYIWILGENLEGEKKAEDAIMLIAKEATSHGLTDIIEKFLKEEAK